MIDFPDYCITECSTPLGYWWRYQHHRNQPSSEKLERRRGKPRPAGDGRMARRSRNWRAATA
jgi:hypothetical protein